MGVGSCLESASDLTIIGGPRFITCSNITHASSSPSSLVLCPSLHTPSKSI